MNPKTLLHLVAEKEFDLQAEIKTAIASIKPKYQNRFIRKVLQNELRISQQSMRTIYETIERVGKK